MTTDQIRQKHIPKIGYNPLSSLYVFECRCGEFKNQGYDFGNEAEEFDAHIAEELDKRMVGA